MLLTQKTQADLTHHLFNVHLPPLARIGQLTCPNQRITYNVFSRRTPCSNSRDRGQRLGCKPGVSRESEMHHEELEDLVGESGRRAPYEREHGHGHASEHSAPTCKFLSRTSREGGSGGYSLCMVSICFTRASLRANRFPFVLRK